jgi:hypothetical protein
MNPLMLEYLVTSGALRNTRPSPSSAGASLRPPRQRRWSAASLRAGHRR